MFILQTAGEISPVSDFKDCKLEQRDLTNLYEKGTGVLRLNLSVLRGGARIGMHFLILQSLVDSLILQVVGTEAGRG